MNHLGTVAFHTLGCKLNFSETSAIAHAFTEAGYARVSFDEPANYYVINTCSVTDNADKKCRYEVKRALRNNPDAQVIVIGCYAQLKPQEIASIPGVSLVLGAEEKFKVLEHLQKTEKESAARIFNAPIKETRDFHPAWSRSDRTRTFLKVQDGCNYFCAFCTIPLARGVSRSASIQQTVHEARKVAQSGAKEVVLTGVNIGDFGHGSDENFLGLIRELDKIEGIERFRISSIEPNLLTDEIIDFVSASNKFVPHFHIPLQSGSDDILMRMRRRYRTELYRNRVEHILQKMPDACIGVDVIVGFPGETDTHFDGTYSFLHSLNVHYLHVFSYSERDNTTAVRMDGVVPMEVRTTRSKALRSLSHKKKRSFYQEQLRKTATVLVESDTAEGVMFGFTENYVKVGIPYNPELVNTLQKVELQKLRADGWVESEVLTKIAEPLF